VKSVSHCGDALTSTVSTMATNEAARPAASAAGPYLRSDAAAPRTIGRIGSTQGDSVVNRPAINAPATEPMPMIKRQRLERLVQQRRNRRPIGVADGASGFTLALECDQGRLHAYVESLHGILLAVEIDDEKDKVLELRI